MTSKARAWLRIGAVLVLMLGMPQAQARDAAFLDPGTSGTNANDEAVTVEPKGTIDTGESIINVARRTTVFFINQTNQPIQVEKVSVNGDGNVTAEITSDDCSKQGTIPQQSRCSVEVAVTPSSPGTWSVDVLLTHNGAGRIARSKLTGKTTGTTATVERKDTGLALNAKEASPVSFGDVSVGSKAVRSALMVNDSPDTISLYSIDVIEADNGLQRLDQGCAVDMELKPGESCPVTLVWTPVNNGQVSTDLIIRHSGRLGFAVIPIRGNAKGDTSDSKDKSKITTLSSDGSKGLPPPPSAQDLQKASAVAIPALSSALLSNSSSMNATLRLIGTVGNRAVLLKPDGETAIVNVGEEFDADGKKAKLLYLTAKTASILWDGKKKDLILGAAPELTTKGRNKETNEPLSAANGVSSTPLLNTGSTLGSLLAPSATPTTPPPITSLTPTAGGTK